MITKENLKEVLEILGFEALYGGGGKKLDSKSLESKQAHIYTKTINSYIMQVDFTKQQLIYPQGIKINDTTTSNFSHPENFVVFECVHRLLEKGYKAESLELEKKWRLGGELKGGKADILVRDNQDNTYLIIECKTTQENSKSEFSKEWERMKENGGQLFSYFQQEKATKFLCLYASDLEAESKSIIYQNYIIQAFDNDEYLQENELENSYKKASNNTELFAVWKESYKLQSFTQGIFESQVNAYKILETTPTFSNLQELKEEGKYHEFAKILRKHNISGKENAFDKLVNIFLCKIYDESFNKNNLKFGYFGVMADTYASMQDRLMLLYKEAMSEFLGEEITFVSNDDIEKAFKKLHAKDLKAQIQKHIKELKFYSNNDFAFLEVHNKELFLQNALVLKEIIELFAPYKLTQNSTNQFLGNLFELFLQKGMKQDEGQFFTPIQICEFIMYALPLDSMAKASKPLKVLDFACGAGHFLNTYANELKRYATQDLQEHYKQIYGIEKEYRLSKVAKVSSAMYGQNEINILYADALATHELENPKTDSGNKQKLQINNHSFDLLIANPPYSVKGFLETLSAKSKKTYTLFSDEINIETNNAIECFFIERANQLLRDNAKAAIILPSSILNKDGIYKSTREILLINFDFIAIVELGSGTFGATGTNTIILFLRKKDSFTPENATISQDYSNIKNYIESGHLSQNEPYKDYINAFNAYCDFRGFDKGAYESFLNGSLESQPNGWAAGFRAQKDLESSYNLDKAPSETKDTEQNVESSQSTTQLLELEAFKEYHAAFKETSEYKKLLDSKAYKDSKDKDTLIHNAFLAYARAIEKDKLLYFSLSLNQAPIIIKAPNDNKEQKKFLGYEWSNRKGDEGLKELHNPYLSPLFERDNPQNENKLAHLIRQAFVSTDMGGVRGLGREKASQIESNPIPQDLSTYAFKAKLIDMLDFSKVDFNKAISLNPTNSQGEGKTQNPFENCKFELIQLAECGEFIGGLWTGKKPPFIKAKVIRNTNFSLKGDLKLDTEYPELEVEKSQFEKRKLEYGDIIIEKSGGSSTQAVGRVVIFTFKTNELYSFSNFTNRLRVTRDDLSPFFLHLVLNYLYQKGVTFLMQNGMSGIRNLDMKAYQRLKIPLPPLEIQKQIVAECEKVEEQYNTIRMSIEKYQELLKAILVKCGIVANTDESIGGGGATSRLIASLLDSIQELESKLDFSLLLQSEVLAQSSQESSPSLRGSEATEAIHKKADSSVGCHDFATQNLAMTGLDLKALLDSIPIPPAQGWNTIKLNNKKYLTLNPSKREIANIDENTIISFVEMASVADKGYIQNKVDKPLKELKKGSYTYFAENDILIAKITPCMENGKCAIAKNLTNGLGMGSSEFHIFRTHKGLNNKFLFACLNQDSIRQEAAKNMTGSSGHRRVPISFYESLQIPLPPIEEQEKIISAIEKLESKIHLLDSSLSHLDSKKGEILQHFLQA